MASSTAAGTETTTGTTATTATVPDDWESIRYVFYLVLGWLVATAAAVALLMFVVPPLF